MNTAHQQITLAVTGMTCRSCAAHVQKALGAVPGVESASVDLATRTAVVAGCGLDSAALLAAVEDAGYAATPAAHASASPHGMPGEGGNMNGGHDHGR